MPVQVLPAQPYVFISYSSRNRDQVLQLAETFNRVGVRYWLDREAIDGGTSYGTEIAEAIRNAAAFVLMCSARSLASRNVTQELLLAWKYERPYLPLLLEPCVFPAEIEYWLEGSQWVEVLDQPEAAWLPRALRALRRCDALSPLTTADEPVAAPDSVTRPLRAGTSHLPTPATTFVGRGDELQELSELLRQHRLVTVTGPGGSGKTRLALEVARNHRGSYPDGVWFVDLSALTDSDLVAGRIAQMLGIQEIPGVALADTVRSTLHHQQALLLLDNFEQVLGAAELVQELLTACLSLQMLITSRTRLNLPAEREYVLDPLPLPVEAMSSTLEEVAAAPAVQLFLARAQAVRPALQLTAANAATIAAICRRLDGLPLALELAASRSKLLGPQALLSRLETRLPLLTGGGPALPRRQQALRDTIAWSYALLDQETQALFRRLAVFAGGSTLAAAEAVCGDGEASVESFDRVSALADSSLLRARVQPDGEPRLSMLETIREFAVGQASSSEEWPSLRARHAAYYLSFAEASAPHLRGAEQQRWLAAIEMELDNFRAALAWSLETSAVEVGLRLVAALHEFWNRRGHYVEGQAWAEQLLALPDAPRSLDRAAALYTAGALARIQGDIGRARSYLEESLQLFREQGEQGGAAYALNLLGLVAMWRGDLAEARTLQDEAVARFRTSGDAWGLAMALSDRAHVSLATDEDDCVAFSDESLRLWRTQADIWGRAFALECGGMVSQRQGDTATAEARFRASLALFREAGNTASSALLLRDLGQLAVLQGEPAQAEGWCEEAVALSRQAGVRTVTGDALVLLGVALLMQRQYEQAESGLQEALAVYQALHIPSGLANCLDALGSVAAGLRQWERAARRFGASAGLRATHALPLTRAFRPLQEQTVLRVRSHLGDEAFQAAWAAGERQPLDDLLALL